MVGIPIFPLLRKELIKRKKGDSEFVFPEQAAMMKDNPYGITLRVQQVLERAGFKDKEEEEPTEKPEEQKAETQEATVDNTKTNKRHKEDKMRGELRQERKVGLRRASIRGFHSFYAGAFSIIHRAMPELLVGKGRTREEEMRELLNKMTGRNWKKNRHLLLKILNGPGSAPAELFIGRKAATRP